MTAVLLVVDGEVGATRRYLGLGLVATLAGWYAVRAWRGPRRAGTVYLMAAAPLTIGLFAVAPVGALMLFASYPHIWLMLPVWRAVPATAVVVAGAGAVTVARDGRAEKADRS